MFFEGDYEVKGISDNTTWKGAGISVAEGKTVKWKVHNPQSDRLAKIGKGKLIVEGKGNNQGSLKVGDGTVVLKQQTTKGQHAFASVGIVSGRSTVVLNDDNQVDPNSIYFGFRGGRLDLNGNSLTFDHIRNIDDGARLVNHNMTNASNITITGESLITNPNTITLYNIEVQDEDNPLRIRLIPYGKQLYFNQDNYTYYTLRKGASTRSEFPQNRGESNDSWLYMGTEKLDAQKNAMNHINNERMNGFNGYFGEEENKNKNGKLNVTFKGKTDQNRFLLTGGTNLNGDLKVEKGTLFLSGRPTPHARDIANISSTNKDPHFAENNEVVVEDDWINRTFKATNINVTNNATLYSGRNVESITSNITASNNAKVHIGYKAGDTVCVRSDYTGYVTCHNGTLSTKALNSFNATNVSGNVNLSDNANFTLGKANLHGSIQAGGNSQVRLTENSHWHLTGDSNVHQLDLKNGHIHLNSTDNKNNVTKYNTLNISNLSGNGSFYYLTDISTNQGDKVVITQSATGNFTLQVADKTGEPNHNELTLFDASKVTERNSLNVSLANGKVDRGAWSYTLKESSGRYYLHNPEAEKRNLTVDTPSITTANNIQADAPSVPSNHEETARVNEAPVLPPAPPAPATTNVAPQNQNGFNRTGTGYSIVADTPETVRITHKNQNGEIIDEGFALKSDFHNSVDTNKKSFDGLVADKITPDGTNAYIITYKKVEDLVKAETFPKEPVKMDNPLTDEEKKDPKVAVVKPEEIPNGAPSREHSETAPKSDTTTQADTSNSETVPSETTEKVAENSPQESEKVEEKEQKATETTPQNNEVAKEAQPSVEANPQTNEVAQNGSKTEETQEAPKQEQTEAAKQDIEEIRPEKRPEPETVEANIDEPKKKSQNGEVAEEATPNVEANTQTNEATQSEGKTEETQTAETNPEPTESVAASKNQAENKVSQPTETKETAMVEKEEKTKVEIKVEKDEIQEVEKVISEKPDTKVKANAPKKEVPIYTKVEEAQPQTQPTTVAAADTTTPNGKPAEETKPNEETNAKPVTSVSQNQAENTTAQPTEREETARVETETAKQQEQPKTVQSQVEPESESVSTDKNSEEVQAQPETSATAVTEQPAKETSTKAEQSVTENTTVSTENPVVENPENTTQPTVNSEAVQSETATTETVVSQPEETSTEETTVASTYETTVTSAEETTVSDNSESSKPKSRSRRDVSSALNNVEPTGTAGRDRSAVEPLRNLTSTNTNAVLSDAMAKAQFVALNVGKAVSQHISQLEMNNEGQYNVWVSNTSMNENYSSSQYRRFSSKSTQTQLGWDQTISSNVQLGGVFTYVRNSNSFDKASSKNTLAQANLYSKYYVDNYWYLAVDLGYGNFQSNLQTNHNAKFARHTAQIGLTAGKAFNLGNFGITPIVGVRYSYLSNADFALAQDRIKVNPISVKTAFAQVDLSYTYHLGEFSITPILSARYDANQGSGKINVNGYDFAYNVENQQQYNAGLKLKYHNVKLSLIGGLTKAKQAEKQKTAEVKLSFSF